MLRFQNAGREKDSQSNKHAGRYRDRKEDKQIGGCTDIAGQRGREAGILAKR